MTDFHFSPRPNRAGEIAWNPWSEDAFTRAKALDKPILLGISAVWCHWCHVMDETTYSDAGVIEAINRDYVAVRVDNDERPDVNARYNMGGWPTTVFLAPDGSILTGFTYVPPPQMKRALSEISAFYSENRENLAERAAAAHERSGEAKAPGAAELDPEAATRVADSIAAGYDDEYGGFGDAPKFPQPEVLEFLLARWRASGEARYHEIVSHTVREMARGGVYDHVEGGFFRYSTTRDWSVPHFEKMAEDHAGLIRVLAQLQLWSPHPDWHATLKSALRYTRTVLRDRSTSLFAGSQDADEAYFSLDLEARRNRPAPYVDRRAYSNWSAALAGAFAWAAMALDDEPLAAEGLATLDALHERLRDSEGLLYHVAEPGQAPRVRGLLTDQAAYLRALLDACELCGEPRFLDRAIALAAAVEGGFGVPGGGYADRAVADAAIGRLELQDRPIGDNALVAESLLRLAAITGEHAYRESAASTLAVFAATYARAGQFAAPYARALERYYAPEVTVKVAGHPEQTAAFREAARRLPAPFVTVGAAPGEVPAAFVCRGSVCAAPVTVAADVRAAFESVAAS